MSKRHRTVSLITKDKKPHSRLPYLFFKGYYSLTTMAYDYLYFCNAWNVRLWNFAMCSQKQWGKENRHCRLFSLVLIFKMHLKKTSCLYLLLGEAPFYLATLHKRLTYKSHFLRISAHLICKAIDLCDPKH